MATLEELVAATKILGESAGEAVMEPDATGFSGLELGENGVEVSEFNKNAGNNDHSVFKANKRAVETEKTVETTFVGKGQLQSHLNVKENEEKGAENEFFVSGDDKSVSVREEECNQNGINLIVDVLGSLDGVDGSKKYFETDGGESSFVENEGGLNITCVLDITGQDDKEEEDGQVMEKQEHGFCVGDFVWGKIRGHPWWPGQIYDPQDASDFAMKHSQRGRLLVAFFGDGSGSWCLPAQLIPFASNFEEMSKGSNSKSFLNAVQRSIDEVGRVLELEMSCKCVAKERKADLARPLVVNAGLKPGVLMPEVDINRLSVPIYEPAEVLEKVKNLAQVVSIGSMLELAVLKSWLSSFYRSKGVYQLAVYYEPHPIEGLEDTSEIGDVVANGFSLPIEGPILGPVEEDWLSSSGTGMQQFPAPSGDKIYRRRKQKSVAELMGETPDIKLKDKKRTSAKDGTDLVKPTSATRKKSKYLSPPYTERINEDSSDENIVREEANEASTPRERKKSKYLSAPYTNLKRRAGNSSSKGESEIESEKIDKMVPVGERMTNADGDLFPSPSISNPVTVNIIPSRQQKGIDSSTHASSQQDENDLKKIFDTVDVDASGNGVLSKVQSAAVDPLYLSKEGSLNMIRGFFSAFRSSIYLDGSNYKEFHGHRRGKKRKLLHFDPKNQGNGTSKTKSKTSEPKIPEAGTSKIDRSASSASLVITFSPGSTLPSKDDVIGMFSKFGSLNEKDTNLVMDSNAVQVEYVKNSDVEKAFRSSVNKDLFGSAILNGSIQHSSVTPEKPDSLRLAGDVISDIGFINQKLEMMSSVMENCNCKISPEKSRLKDAMKHLLEKVGSTAEKVRTMVDTTST
ncbi:Hypothetical predicted protein [Olea europaea subsp. europaea]|uniref:PWWP domain-containing protein n=1 Tax=Olea europaea subsp. europaea TaxID=158383 RepID=A0A8S0VK73_OLEEU|nr:Hypothetical predicted protein [Olea europaea subsp. europaea]